MNYLVGDKLDVSYNAKKIEMKIMGYFWVWIHLVMVKTIRINMIYAKKYTAEEVIRLSGKQNI